jgi:ribosomal protein S12 methylthiotransferase
MAHQQKISADLLRKKVGKRLPVLIDEANGTAAKGRSKYDAPEIDGAVQITARRPLRAGEIVTVKIDRADAYDLYGQAT